MLKIQQLRVSYGGIQALRGIDLEVPDGKIVTLIGANGAGKSTTLRTISGLVKAESGSIQWNGEELLGKPIDKIISAGIAMSPEGRRVFADLTVLENLKLGAYLRKDKAEIEKDLKWVYELFPRLEERNWQSAGTLSGGEQRALRKLMASNEKKIETLKGKIEKKQLEMAAADQSDYLVLTAMQEEIADFEAQIESLELEWFEAAEKLGE